MTKRKLRGGRPRKEGVPRTPSGQISRAIALNPDFGPTAEALAHRAADIEAYTGMAIDPSLLRSEDAGWSIGRLYLAGALGDLEKAAERAKDLRTAGERYWRRAEAYRRLLLGPQGPRVAGAERGRSVRDNEQAYVKAKAEYDASFEKLREAGARYALALARAMRDEPVVLQDLVAGLAILDGAEDCIRKAGRDAVERYRRMRESGAA